MSRVLLVNQSEEAVAKACARFDVAISVIETLDSGGVRLVCVTTDGAVTMRRKLRAKLIDGPVVRSRIFTRGAQPYLPVLTQSAGSAHKA
jgi:hypothetical protein